MQKDAERDVNPELEVKGAQTLMRALDILDAVIDGPVRTTDLARRLEVSKTTAHRLVQALRSRNYLAVTPEGLALGPKLLHLGRLATEQIDYVRVARPFMEALSEETGICVFLAKREGDWSRHLERVTGSQRLRVATAPGDRRPVAETGLGKTLLLDESEEEWERLYRFAFGKTVTAEGLGRYLDQMRKAKADGSLVHDSQLGDGVRSIAAPVRDSYGKICVAISIASAAFYMADEDIAKLRAAVVRTADRISESLGYRKDS